MDDWTAGYITDVAYTYGYYRELAIPYQRMALLNAGLVPPEYGSACELGFGQGLSINFHAAGSTADWYGTDFNPAQVSFAREMAGFVGNGARLFDETFADFCHRPDLPDFDYIAVHGIWSWISAENRAVIVDFLRRKLKVGGVLYISYNSKPGCAASIPLRELLTAHADVMGAPGRGIISRVEAALDFVERLFATDPAYPRLNPSVIERLKQMKSLGRDYLAHEYFNKDWQPMSVAEMAAGLAPAKLEFGCSARFLDHFTPLNLTAAQQQFLADLPDPIFRETVRDHMVNQHFRCDYWIKGLRRMPPLEQAEALRQQRVVLTKRRERITPKMTGALGEATMLESIYGPVLDALADGHPKTIGQLEDAVRGRGLSLAQTLEAVTALIGKDDLSPAQENGTIVKARKTSDKLNAYLCDKARSSDDINYLVSPVTGAGLPVSRSYQLFLQAHKAGRKTAEECAGAAWQILASQGQYLVRDGKTLATPEENLAELTAQAKEFLEYRLPILKSLGVV